MSKTNLLKTVASYRNSVVTISTSVSTFSIDPLESRFVAKIFKKNQRKKKNGEKDIFDVPVRIPDKVLDKYKRLPQAKPIMSVDNPRLQQTEKVLHENISNVIQTGQLGITVPVTKVRLLPDFSQLNVYWEATGDTKHDKKIQNTLNSRTKPLRYLLSTAKESQYVPTISFLKDLSYAKEQELENYFKTLDTGKVEHEMENTSEDCGANTRANTGVEVEENTESNEVKWIYNRDVFDVPYDMLMKKVMNSKLKYAGKNSSDSVEHKSESGFRQDENNIPGKMKPSKSARKKINLKRREDVKQITKLLGLHTKSKNNAYLKGDLTHLIPDVLEQENIDRDDREKLEEYRAQRPAYFERRTFRHDKQTLENFDEHDEKD